MTGLENALHHAPDGTTSKTSIARELRMYHQVRDIVRDDTDDHTFTRLIDVSVHNHGLAMDHIRRILRASMLIDVVFDSDDEEMTGYDAVEDHAFLESSFLQRFGRPHTDPIFGDA